jgi:hypothetical protein
LLDFAENPSWVLNWRSSQPAEKTAEERGKKGLRRRGRYSALGAGETIRFEARIEGARPQARRIRVGFSTITPTPEHS